MFLMMSFQSAFADETCQSPYMPKIVGQEDYVYIITVGVAGMGDGSDKLVTIGVNPKKETYGKIISVASVGGRHEFHHGGLTDDRRYLWAGGLDKSKIFIFDLATDPANPKVANVIENYAKVTGGVVGPHTMYALPGRMIIANLSNSKDYSGRTALTEFTNDGKFIRTIWMPDDAPFGYDIRVNARLNRMLTSSFTGRNNYMRNLKEVVEDENAMNNDSGNEVVLWDLHARKPLQIFKTPGFPLEIRWALMPQHNYAFVHAAAGNTIYLIDRQEDGTFASKPIIDLSDPKDPEKAMITGDISLSAEDKYLFVAFIFEGTTSIYDVSDPHNPKPVITHQKIGGQINMISQSWDGKRIYFTSSSLSKWDAMKEDGTYLDQYFKSYSWDGKKLDHLFTVDFLKEDLGLAHLMRFGQDRFYKNLLPPAE